MEGVLKAADLVTASRELIKRSRLLLDTSHELVRESRWMIDQARSDKRLDAER